MDAAQNKVSLKDMRKHVANYALETSSEVARRMRRKLFPHNQETQLNITPFYHADVMFSLVTRGYFTKLVGAPNRLSSGVEWSLTTDSDLAAVIPSRFLVAKYEDQGITTRVLCTPQFPATLRYNKRTQQLHMSFFAEATHDVDGTRVLSARPKRVSHVQVRIIYVSCQ